MSDETLPRPQPGLEIATTGDGRDITRPYSGGMAVPYDPVLRLRGGGDLAIYEQVLSDGQVKSCFEQRRNAVTSAEWQVEAGGDRRIDKRAAEWAEKQIKAIGFDRVTDRMLYAVHFGYSVAELLWDVQEGLLGWKAIKVRNRRRFRFAADGSLRLITPQKPSDGEPAPAPYFWHIATGSDNDDEPYGTGLAHWCYWPALFKRNGIAFWLTFLDKFGSPTAVGKFPVGSTDGERAKLLAALRAIRTDSGIILPEGMTAELLEAARSGTADYKTLIDTMDTIIAKVVIGQTASTQGTPGRLGNDKLQSDVRQDIVKADADLVCESFNLGPLRWLTMFNFPGAALPRMFRLTEEPEDLNAIADRDKKVGEMGFKPGLDYVHETYGDHWEPKQEASDLRNSSNSPAAIAQPRDLTELADGSSLAAARREAQDRLDTVLAGADTASEDWRVLVEPRVRELQVLLDETGDLLEFRRRVIQLADAAPNDTFVETLARAGFAANLIGRIPKEQ